MMSSSIAIDLNANDTNKAEFNADQLKSCNGCPACKADAPEWCLQR